MASKCSFYARKIPLADWSPLRSGIIVVAGAHGHFYKSATTAREISTSALRRAAAARRAVRGISRALPLMHLMIGNRRQAWLLMLTEADAPGIE